MPLKKEMVIVCFVVGAIIFKNAGRKNYSLEALNLLCQHQYRLSPRQSAELIWSRFINVHGIAGRNISNDLHMEHLNRILKGAIGNLGVNKTEAAIRVGNALGTLSPVLDQFDRVNSVPECSKIRSVPTYEKDRDMIIHELQKSKVFLNNTTARAHKTIPKPKAILDVKDKGDFAQWMVEHI